jgi:hypothetical protein
LVCVDGSDVCRQGKHLRTIAAAVHSLTFHCLLIPTSQALAWAVSHFPQAELHLIHCYPAPGPSRKVAGK